MWVKEGSGFKPARMGKNEHLVSTYCVLVTFHTLPHSGYTPSLEVPHLHFAENETGARTKCLI